MARTTRTPKIRLGELLVAAGLVTEDKVRHGLEEQRRNNLFLGEALVNLGYVTEEGIAQAIIQHFNLPFLAATQFNIPPDVYNLFPERMYYEYQFIAVDKIAQVIIIIAAGPINQDMMEELERVSECKICHYVSTWRDIYAAISRNSKELGGQAQVELTGLGSMLLDGPTKEGKSGTAKVRKLERSMPTIGSSSVAPMPTKVTMIPNIASVRAAMSSPNLSGLLSPLAASSKAAGLSQTGVATPPSPRLTAFLKVPAPTASSAGMPAAPRNTARTTATPSMSPTAALSSANLLSVMGQSSAGMPAASNANVSAVLGVPAAGIPAADASTNLPAVTDDQTATKEVLKAKQPRMSSFLRVKKD